MDGVYVFFEDIIEIGYEVIVFSNFERFVYLWEDQIPKEYIEPISEILRSNQYEVIRKDVQLELEKSALWSQVQRNLFSYV